MLEREELFPRQGWQDRYTAFPLSLCVAIAEVPEVVQRRYVTGIS